MVSFLERKLHSNGGGTSRAAASTYLRIVVLVDRLFVLCDAGTGNTTKEDMSEGQVICSKLSFLLEDMNSALKARTYYALGSFHFHGIGSLKMAKGYLEMARNLLLFQDSLPGNDNSKSDFITTLNAISEIDDKLYVGNEVIKRDTSISDGVDYLDPSCTKSAASALQGLN